MAGVGGVDVVGGGGGAGRGDYASRFTAQVPFIALDPNLAEVNAAVSKTRRGYDITLTPKVIDYLIGNPELGGLDELIRGGVLARNNLDFGFPAEGLRALGDKLAKAGLTSTYEALSNGLRTQQGGPAQVKLLKQAYDQALIAPPPQTNWALPGANTSDTSRVAKTLRDAPSEISRDYSFKISDSGVLSINPASRPTGFATTRGMSVANNAVGGKDVTLEGGAITRAEWTTGTLMSMVKREELAMLERAGYPLTSDQQFLAVRADGDEKPTYFLFAPGGKQFVSICNDVAIHNMPTGSSGAGGGGGGGGGVTVRKPVVYLYPERRTEMTVKVTIAGTFIAQYPKADGDTWRLVADPTGVLFDPRTERRYSYIFWEGLNPNAFEIDRTKAHCIAGDKAEAFLELCADKYALNDRERTDFVSYWLPSLEANRFNLVQVLDDATYEGYARMVVTPTPETTLRLFMIFSALNEPVKVGAPAFEARLRKGSCVVEWGGCNLDEPAAKPRQ